MNNIQSPGTIFLSHSSNDKLFVERVLNNIPQSHVFYDVRTLNPGTSTADALQDAILDASVFCLFLSHDASESVWVNYEAA